MFERDADGQALRAIGVMIDITQRHRYEQQLFEEKELAQVTLSSIGDAVITTDTRGRVREINPVAEQLTGWSTAEAQGRDLSEVFRLISELDRMPVSDPVARVLGWGQMAWVEDSALLVSRDGREFSIADAALFYITFWAAGRMKMPLPKNIAAHYERMKARPAVKRTVEQEGLAGAV